jgi:hypothetical protein
MGRLETGALEQFGVGHESAAGKARHRLDRAQDVQV